MPSANVSYGRLADKIQVDFKIFKIFYRLKYFDLYFINVTATLFIVSVRSAFQLVFSNKA